ncbi:hypothetical protein N8I77_012694 [Diaporthe amygdali]|uniref:Berberine/berberine-like domain-containing protein n=1 Tax=Phomopsis amygdali TaxID=1214568 RepID=A0AAD9VXG3_PHOAM|nr:hypothetical protein N8I77_012694 [Diaporthe amygdali]
MHSSGGHNLEGVYYGNETGLSMVLDPLLKKAGGDLSMQPGTWIQGLEYYAERNSLTPSTNEHGNFFATSLTLKNLHGEALTDFVRYWHNHALAFTRGGWFVQLDVHGGANSAISAVSNTATAYAHRDKTFLIQFYHFSGNDEPYPSNGIDILRNWVDVTITTMNDGDYGMYINYSDSQLDRGTAEKLYWAGNLDRLKLIKKAFDPFELFYYPQSIEPAK